MHFSNLIASALAADTIITDEKLNAMTDAMVVGISSMSTAVLAVIAAGIPSVLGVISVVSIGKFIIKWAKSLLARIG